LKSPKKVQNLVNRGGSRENRWFTASHAAIIRARNNGPIGPPRDIRGPGSRAFADP